MIQVYSSSLAAIQQLLYCRQLFKLACCPTPLLHKLHWCQSAWCNWCNPIQFACLTFKSLHSMGLACLRDRLHLITSIHSPHPERVACCRSHLSGNYVWWAWASRPSLPWHPLYETVPRSEVSSIHPYPVEVSQDLTSLSGQGVSGDW